MHTDPDNILIKDILFSYGSYYTSLVRVLVWLSEAVTEICCKKTVLIFTKRTFKKYLWKDFIFSKVTDCRHATWLKINFFTGIFYCVTGVTGQPQLASLQFFDLQFFKITYWQLHLFHQSSFKNYEKRVEAFMIQYPKKFYEDPYPKKCFSRVKNEIKYFPHFLSIP